MARERLPHWCRVCRSEGEAAGGLIRRICYLRARFTSLPQPRQKRSSSLISMPQAGHVAGLSGFVAASDVADDVLGAIGADEVAAMSAHEIVRCGCGSWVATARPHPEQKASPANTGAPQKAQASAAGAAAAASLMPAPSPAATGRPHATQKTSTSSKGAPQARQAEGDSDAALSARTGDPQDMQKASPG
jgi:hypothetical protein